MKKLMSALIVLAALNHALALPNFEPFADATAAGGTSYTVGSNLVNAADGQTNGANVWIAVGVNNAANGQPTLVAGNLSYADLPVSTGNSVSFIPTNGMSARMGLNVSTTPGVAYYSFILKVTDISAVPTSAANNSFAGFSDTVTGPQGANLSRSGARLVAMQVGGGYVLGVGLNTVTTEYQYDATVRNVDDTLFIVASYERVGGNTNVNLWINPASSSFGSNSPPAPTIGQTNGTVNASALNANGARAFVIFCQNPTAPSGIIDEVRVATNWASVTGGNPTFPIAVAAQPASRTVEVGDKVAFVVGASGTSPSYQWRFEGTNILDSTNAAYSIASAQTTNAGSYSVVVTNVLNALTSAPAVLTVSQTALQLYETNLVVVRVGDGAQTLATSGNSVFLDQFTTAGTYVNTIFIPDTGASALIESGPDLNGATLTGAALTRSADKRLLALAGYNAGLTNATALNNTLSADVPRGIVTIDSSSQVTLALADTNAYSAGHFRGAATDGTNNFWGSGSIEGTYYFGLNSPASLVQTVFANTRSVDIFNGDLYCLGSTTGANGLIKFTGLPTTDQGAVANFLTGFNSVNTTDFSVDTNGTLIYLTVGSSVQKWQFDGSTWTNNAYSLALPSAARYLTVDYSGASPVIYVDTADGLLMKIVDSGAGSPATTLAASGPNQLFKGIRFGPIESSVARPTLLFARAGSDLILNWSGAFTLQSATNVTGPYSDVAAAASPYTNTTLSPARQFFRLRN